MEIDRVTWIKKAEELFYQILLFDEKELSTYKMVAKQLINNIGVVKK